MTRIPKGAPARNSGPDRLGSAPATPAPPKAGRPATSAPAVSDRLDAPVVPRSQGPHVSLVGKKPPEKANATYDFVVVGSGPGGAPAAARLAEAGYRVLVLEAGEDHAVPESEPLALHAVASESPELLTRRTGEFIHHREKLEDDRKDPKFIDGKGVFVPRGEGIGGSARMNAGIFVRPDDVDWNSIAQATGDPSWAAPEMLKYFQKVEDAEYQPVLKLLHAVGKGLHLESLQNLGGHGFDGWLEVNRPVDAELLRMLRDNPQLRRMVVETFEYTFTKVGSALDRVKMLASLLDPNTTLTNNVSGMVFTPLTVTKDGRRNGPRDRLLDAAASHPEALSIVTGARVQDFVMNADHEAIAVRYRTPDGQLHTEPFKRELVLSAGVFETPAILMRSGVAPERERETLQKHGIALQVVREGVGQHLKGRYEIGVVQRLKEPLPVLTETDFSADPSNPAYEKWKETGKGMFAQNGIVAAFRVKSDPSLAEPDLYVFGVPGKFEGYQPGYSREATADAHYVTWVILDENKRDQNGSVALDPQDVNGRVVVNQHFHEGPDDTRALVNGIKVVRALSARYADIVEKEEWPGDAVTSDEALAEAVRDNSWDHHPNGTTQIGSADDPQAVVDSDLRVIGLKGVRVSDASVFRGNMGSFIQSAILTVSEKAAAELIETAQKEDGQGAGFSPWEVRETKTLSPKNTVSDNVFLALHDRRRTDEAGVLTPGALEELVELTRARGITARELAQAQEIAKAFTAAQDQNAEPLAVLAEALRVGRADQGFLLDLSARLRNRASTNDLPSPAPR